MMNRRHFLSISAIAALGLGLHARAERFDWKGQAFGADIGLSIYGDLDRANACMNAVKTEIRRLEGIFSVYDPNSELSQLNARGHVDALSLDLRSMLEASANLWRVSGYKFDPTIQSLWQGQNAKGFQVIGFASALSLNGAQLSLNGIAQGYATDQVFTVLKRYGFDRLLVNMGEFRAGQGRWPVNISDPNDQLIDAIQLGDLAIATSQPNAMKMQDGKPHIIGVHGERPQWQSVSVMAQTAMMADGFSTAISLMSEAEIREIDFQNFGIERVILQDGNGDVQHI